MKVTQEIKSQAVNQAHKTSSEKQSLEAMVQSQTHKLRQQEIRHLVTEITKQGINSSITGYLRN